MPIRKPNIPPSPTSEMGEFPSPLTEKPPYITPFGKYTPTPSQQSPHKCPKQLDKPQFIAPSIDAHQALGSPSIPRCPPSPWLSLRESWREAPERAHCTDSSHRPPTAPPHRFLIRNCIPPPTVCTTPLPLPSGGTSPHGARQGPGANFKHPHKPRFMEQFDFRICS